jgi:Domain of unknown function (DUF4145)
MASISSWRCPYCQQIATLLDENRSTDTHYFEKGNKDGSLALRTWVVVCPNTACREYTLSGALFKADYQGVNLKAVGAALLHWTLKPQSSARPFPDYIPEVIRKDYEEACLIRDLSPKASATLSRRCLQGIIRDFWGIAKARLKDEVDALQGKVDAPTWQAIDAVRSIGNIGAHMERDINLIVEVEPDEAAMLIGLLEVLMEEWYIRKHERDEHMQKIIAAAAAKKMPPGPASP